MTFRFHHKVGYLLLLGLLLVLLLAPAVGVATGSQIAITDDPLSSFSLTEEPADAGNASYALACTASESGCGGG